MVEQNVLRVNEQASSWSSSPVIFATACAGLDLATPSW
jgi:hypothetical protein